MAWIEFHPGKIKKLKKFSDLRRMLQWNVNETLGFLGSFWGEVIDLREDGNITGWNPEYICDLTGIGIDPERVWDALVSCGWIDAVPERVLVHDWLETAGKFLAKKYSTSNRELLIAIWKLHGKKYGSDQQADEKRTERVPTLPFPSPPNQPKKKDSLSELPTEAVGLAELLKSLILKNNPKARVPTSLLRWADTAALMARIDKRQWWEIRKMIVFSQNDMFWKSNILSMEKLRLQFDQLWMKSSDAKGNSNGQNSGSSELDRLLDREFKPRTERKEKFEVPKLFTGVEPT